MSLIMAILRFCSWALVKDQSIAKKMVKYIELSTIGVSKDSQLRAAKVMKVVSDSCGTSARPRENFFGYCHHLMAERWKLLREAVKQSGIFSLPEFEPGFCNFFQCLFEPLPGTNNAEAVMGVTVPFIMNSWYIFLWLDILCPLCSFCMVES